MSHASIDRKNRAEIRPRHRRNNHEPTSSCLIATVQNGIAERRVWLMVLARGLSSSTTLSHIAPLSAKVQIWREQSSAIEIKLPGGECSRAIGELRKNDGCVATAMTETTEGESRRWLEGAVRVARSGVAGVRQQLTPFVGTFFEQLGPQQSGVAHAVAAGTLRLSGSNSKPINIPSHRTAKQSIHLSRYRQSLAFLPPSIASI